MLAITDILGETKYVNGIQSIVRSRKVNGEKAIELISVPVEGNNYDFVDTESRFLFQNEPYIIKKISEKNQGRYSIKTAHCVHRFYDDMINSFQYENFTGSQTFAAALTRVFGPTDYDFSIVDSFTAESFENFGRDNCLSLFQTVLERYGAEFEVIGTRVYLRRQIGSDTDFQLRWKHNIKSIEKQVDTENLATVIRGFGGTPDDKDNYPIQREYRSNVELFGELHASAVYDERLSTIEGMDAHLEKTLVSEPQLSITVDIAAIEGNPQNEGDRGYIIYEPMKIKVGARAVEINETFNYHERKWKVRQTAVTLSNLRNKLTDVTTRFAQTSKQFDRLMEGREKLPFNVLPEAIRAAAEAINNSLTEVQYPPGQGIVLQDPNNPNIIVRLTSAGIGLSTDGGVTYRTAMTGTGIVADEIVTGILRANNVTIQGEEDIFFWDGTGLWAYDPTDMTRYVKLTSAGLYIAKGAFMMERPDGYVTVNNGIMTSEFAIDRHEPDFEDSTVSVNGIWKRTESTSPANFNAYFYRHDSRYVKIRFALHDSGTGLGARMSVYEIGNGGALLGQRTVYNVTSGQAVEETLTLDVGVPTGAERGFYIKLNTNTGGSASLRVLKKMLSG